MPIYASTFISGLEPVVKECLPRLLRGCQIYDLYNGLIVYRYDGKPDALARVNIFSNTYLVLHRQNNPTFKSMVQQAAAKADPSFTSRVRTGQTFRGRFQKNGKLERVDAPVIAQAEDLVKRRARLRIDRENPDWEFWYIIRSENIGLYCMLVERREQTEKNLPQGALRPELAQCICLYSGAGAGETLLDPFAGHGSLPGALLKSRKYAAVMMGDNDSNAVRRLRRQFSSLIEEGKAAVYQWDARDMTPLEDDSIDRIITDPPWGMYDAERYGNLLAFYVDFMCEFARVLRPGGTLVMLSAAKAETMRASHEAGLMPTGKLDILVNGKKASIFRYRKPFSKRDQRLPRHN